MRSRHLLTASALVLTLVAAPLAQQQLDRTKPPTPGPVPELKVPEWKTGKLANGAQLIVAERRDLPLIAFTITFRGGVNQFEKPEKLGTGTFTTAMLREGTKTRSAEQLALDLQMLGTNVGANIADESGTMSFLSTTEKFRPTLDILADMLLNPTFPADAL